MRGFFSIINQDTSLMWLCTVLPCQCTCCPKAGAADHGQVKFYKKCILFCCRSSRLPAFKDTFWAWVVYGEGTKFKMRRRGRLVAVLPKTKAVCRVSALKSGCTTFWRGVVFLQVYRFKSPFLQCWRPCGTPARAILSQAI